MKKENLQFTRSILKAVLSSCFLFSGFSAAVSAQENNPNNQLSQEVDGEVIGGNKAVCSNANANTPACNWAGALETKYEANCPLGMTGQNQYQRKVYVRPTGSRVEEPWYLTQNNCVKVVEPSLSDGQRTQTTNMINNSTNTLVANLNNMSLTPNQAQQIQNIVNSGGAAGKGSLTSPIFVVADYNTTSLNNYTGVCVAGIPGENFQIRARTDPRYAPPLVRPRPYPSWQGVDDPYFPGTQTCLICPAGSSLQPMSYLREVKPENGGDPGTE